MKMTMETSIKGNKAKTSSPNAPQLEWSSDSSAASDEDAYACNEPQQQQHYQQHQASPHLVQHRRSRNLIDLTDDEAEEPGGSGETNTPPSPPPLRSTTADATALLRTVAAVHLPRAPARYDANYGEARTSISSPGRRLTLRERVRARARLQRQIHVARNGDYVGEGEDLDDSGIAVEEDYQQHHDSYPTLERNRSNRSQSSASTTPKQAGGMRVQIVPTQAVPAPDCHATKTATNKPHANRILLHVYDLIEKDTLMMLPPFGCVVEIGKCFADMNSALHAVGTGAYHVGVEINGVEYAYGATSVPHQTGVFTCFPRLSPGYQYRTTIDLGERPLVRRSWVAVHNESSTVYQQVQEYVQGRTVIKEMAPEYMGIDYDILRKNCCTFARDACLRLGVPDEEIPTWFRNLAESGALTQDAVRATVEPLTSVLSLACEDISPGHHHACMMDGGASEQGIETIFQTTEHRSVVVVEDPQDRSLRRTSTWAY